MTCGPLETDRVTKIDYKPFLERIARNVNILIANRNKTSILDEKALMMNEDAESATITIKEHASMMKAQHAYF